MPNQVEYQNLASLYYQHPAKTTPRVQKRGREMNSGRSIVLLVSLMAVSVTFTGLAVAGGSPYYSDQGNVLLKKAGLYTESIDMLFDVGQGGELLLGTTNGSVKINTWARDQVRLVITKTTNASSAYNARTILEDFLVQTRHRGRDLQLKAEANTEACKNSVGVVFTVWVPKNYNVDIKTGRGDVDIGKLNGSFSAKTAEGKITWECEPAGMDIEVEDHTRDSHADKATKNKNDGGKKTDEEPTGADLDKPHSTESGSGRL
jgi:hypothetical protein